MGEDKEERAQKSKDRTFGAAKSREKPTKQQQQACVSASATVGACYEPGLHERDERKPKFYTPVTEMNLDQLAKHVAVTEAFRSALHSGASTHAARGYRKQETIEEGRLNDWIGTSLYMTGGRRRPFFPQGRRFKNRNDDARGGSSFQPKIKDAPLVKLREIVATRGVVMIDVLQSTNESSRRAAVASMALRST